MDNWGAWLFFFFVAIVFIATVSDTLRRRRLRKRMKYTPPNIYGAAAWASEKALKTAGLFKRGGIPLGYFEVRGRFFRRVRELFFCGTTHLITFGGTGTGKTTQALVPAAMMWPYSGVFL